MRQDPAIPEMALNTKKEYLSGKKEMTKLRIPRNKNPYTKTGLAEYKSETRPQKRRNAPNVTAYAVYD